MALHFTRDANWYPNHNTRTLQIQYRLSIESNTSSQRLAKWIQDGCAKIKNGLSDSIGIVEQNKNMFCEWDTRPFGLLRCTLLCNLKSLKVRLHYAGVLRCITNNGKKSQWPIWGGHLVQCTYYIHTSIVQGKWTMNTAGPNYRLDQIKWAKNYVLYVCESLRASQEWIFKMFL